MRIPKKPHLIGVIKENVPPFFSEDMEPISTNTHPLPLTSSPMHPSCLANMGIGEWAPLNSCSSLGTDVSSTNLSKTDLQRIQKVLSEMYTKATRPPMELDFLPYIPFATKKE